MNEVERFKQLFAALAGSSGTMVEHDHEWVDHLHTCSCEKRGWEAGRRYAERELRRP